MPLLSSLEGDKSNGTEKGGTVKVENIAPVAEAAASNGNTSNGESTEAPPSYAPTDPLPAEPVDGPTAEQLSAAFSSLRLSEHPPRFPDEDTCLAHLKLLSTFHSLKEDIGYTDGLFNLWDAKCEALENRDESLAKMREKRWVLYIARAVERFEDWWTHCLCTLESNRRLEGKEMMANVVKFTDFPKLGSVQRWTTSILPPIGRLPNSRQCRPANVLRCPHGLARIHAQPQKLPRRLYAIRIERSLGYRYALASSQRSNRYQLQLQRPAVRTG